MIYLDVAYIARLYFEDPGWEQVRDLAARAHVGCAVHGYAEVMSVMHRKFREGSLNTNEYRRTREQFLLDCSEGAFQWLPLSATVNARVEAIYAKLPRSVFLRASDGLHLACASENGLPEIYSNDQRLLAAASHFGIRGVNII